MTVPLRLDFFPTEIDVAHEHHLPPGSGRAPGGVVYYPGASREGGHDGIWLRIRPAGGLPWTGVFSTEERAPLRLVASWPHPHLLFVAAGDAPHLVDVRDPDAWQQLPLPRPRRLEPVGGLALVVEDDLVTAYDAQGMAWQTDRLGSGRPLEWLGALGPDEVVLRSPDDGLRHTLGLRAGTVVTEAEPR